MEFTFKAPVLDFVNWLKFDQLRGLCTDSKPTPFPRLAPTQYWFSSRNSEYFTNLYPTWYTIQEDGSKIKILPNRPYMDKYFTEVSLAFLIMGDGYWENDSSTVIICTDNFTKAEVESFIVFLKDRFGLTATLKKRKKGEDDYPRVRFSSTEENLSLLRDLVEPYMHPLMLYKINKHN